MQGGLAARALLQVVFAGHVAGMAMGGDDEADLQPLDLVDQLIDRQPRIDDYRLFGRRVGNHVSVDLAIKLHLDDAELHKEKSTTSRERSLFASWTSASPWSSLGAPCYSSCCSGPTDTSAGAPGGASRRRPLLASQGWPGF